MCMVCIYLLPIVFLASPACGDILLQPTTCLVYLTTYQAVQWALHESRARNEYMYIHV